MRKQLNPTNVRPLWWAILGLALGMFFGVRATACPADLTGDGVLDNGDLALFIELHLESDLRADLNGDTISDNADLAAYIEVFLGGCDMATADEIKVRASWNATASGNATSIKGDGVKTLLVGVSDSLALTNSTAPSGQGWSYGGHTPAGSWTPDHWWGYGCRLNDDTATTKPSFDPFTVEYLPSGAGGTGATVDSIRPSVDSGSTSTFPTEYIEVSMGDGSQTVSDLVKITVDITKMPAAFQGELDIWYAYDGDATNGGRVFMDTRRGSSAGLAAQQLNSAVNNQTLGIVKASAVAAGNDNIEIYMRQDTLNGDQSTKTFRMGTIILLVRGATEGLCWVPLGIGSTDTLDWTLPNNGGSTGGVISDTQLDEWTNQIRDDLGPDDVITMFSLGQNDDLSNLSTYATRTSDMADRWRTAWVDAGEADPGTIFFDTHGTASKTVEFHANVGATHAQELLDQQTAGFDRVSFASLFRFYNDKLFSGTDSLLLSGQNVHYSESGAVEAVGVNGWTLLTTDYEIPTGGQRSRSRSRER